MRDVQSEYAKRGLLWGPRSASKTPSPSSFAAPMPTARPARISDLAKVAGAFRPGSATNSSSAPTAGPACKALRPRPHHAAQTMDLGLTYRALAASSIDVIAGNSTDGLIDALGLVVLEDDRHFFPPYDTVIVSRNDIARKCAAAPAALQSLAGIFDEPAMRRLNHAIDAGKRAPAGVAREALASLGK